MGAEISPRCCACYICLCDECSELFGSTFARPGLVTLARNLKTLHRKLYSYFLFLVRVKNSKLRKSSWGMRLADGAVDGGTFLLRRPPPRLFSLAALGLEASDVCTELVSRFIMPGSVIASLSVSASGCSSLSRGWVMGTAGRLSAGRKASLITWSIDSTQSNWISRRTARGSSAQSGLFARGAIMHLIPAL